MALAFVGCRLKTGKLNHHAFCGGRWKTYEVFHFCSENKLLYCKFRGAFRDDGLLVVWPVEESSAAFLSLDKFSTVHRKTQQTCSLFLLLVFENRRAELERWFLLFEGLSQLCSDEKLPPSLSHLEAFSNEISELLHLLRSFENFVLREKAASSSQQRTLIMNRCINLTIFLNNKFSPLPSIKPIHHGNQSNGVRP